MRCFVLAGGFGSRLQPYTDVLPKCLLPVYSKPCARWIVEHLQNQGFSNITICINEPYKELWMHEFRDLNIKFSVTPKPLGSAGELLRAAVVDIQETFLMVYGDDLSFLNYRKLVEFHRSKADAIGTLALTKKVPLEVGVVTLNDQGLIREFREKPYLDLMAWTGVACLEPEILNYMDWTRETDFARDVLPSVLRDGKKLYGYSEDVEWLDIGSITHFKKASEKAQKGELIR